MRWFTRMARKAANRATNVNAVLLACERSQILFSLDQQQRKHHPTSPMPKKGKQVSANDDSEVYEVEDILDDRVNPKVSMLYAPYNADTHTHLVLIISPIAVASHYLTTYTLLNMS